jgi:hypothetical protein
MKHWKPSFFVVNWVSPWVVLAKYHIQGKIQDMNKLDLVKKFNKNICIKKLNNLL